MEVRPGYKQTEVGVIPEDWEVVPLGKISDLEAGLSKPGSVFGSGCLVVMVQNLYEGSQINVASLRRVVATDNEILKYRLSPGEVLLGNASVQRDGIGYANQFGGADEDVIFAKYAYRARNLRCVHPFFLLLALRTTVCRQWIIALSQTGTLTNLNKLAANAIPIPLPPTLMEQEAIAEAMSDVDGLLGGLDRLIAKKRDLKQAAMQQLLTGQTRLPGFHGEWEVKTFGDLFNFSGGYSASRDQLSTDGHCYLHYGDIHGATKTTVDVRADYQNIPKLKIPLKRVASKSLLEDGDVVFVDASEDDEGASRHVVVVNKDKKPFISGLHTIVAKSKTDELAHEYRRYCFQTAAIRQQFLFYAVGTKVSGISKTNIAKLKMPVPKVPEQSAIAEVLTEMDAELAALGQRREKTRALKQAMMQELLTGKTRLV